jgi:hypothetical protein
MLLQNDQRLADGLPVVEELGYLVVDGVGLEEELALVREYRWLDGPAQEQPEKARSENGPTRRCSCLGLAWHDCRAMPGPPPRHGGSARARHGFWASPIRPDGLLTAHQYDI